MFYIHRNDVHSLIITRFNTEREDLYKITVTDYIDDTKGIRPEDEVCFLNHLETDICNLLSPSQDFLLAYVTERFPHLRQTTTSHNGDIVFSDMVGIMLQIQKTKGNN